jgi:hypothetical protein
MWQLYIGHTLYVTGLTTTEAFALMHALQPLTPALVELVFDGRRHAAGMAAGAL